MNPFRKWLETELSLVRRRAEQEQRSRIFLESLFLLGIEIGRGRELAPGEKLALLRTFPTAQALAALHQFLEEGDPIPAWRRAYAQAVGNWSGREAMVRANLEVWFGGSLDEVAKPRPLCRKMRGTLKSQLQRLAAACGEQLDDTEVEAILDRLEHPLDRA
jgi:hypothetical protein